VQVTAPVQVRKRIFSFRPPGSLTSVVPPFALSVLAKGRIVSSGGRRTAGTGHTGQHKELHMNKAAYE